MSVEAVPRCDKAECQVSVTRKCAEGHDPLRACPNFLGIVEEPAEEDEDQLELEQPPDLAEADSSDIRLSSGELLSVAEVERFLLWRSANFIAIIGDSNSGKTTLICALYDRLLRGPFAQFGFVSSRTLVALEKRIYPCRVESGRYVPDTPRTSISDGLRYFHLAVAPTGSPDQRIDLMISDRAGETYRVAKSDTKSIADLTEIPRADTLVLLLDGDRVADPAERAGAIQGARQMLRALLDNGALDARSVVQVVTTKIDRIAKAQDREAAWAAVAAFRDKAANDFSARLGSLSFRDIAARDPDGFFNPAHGMDALIADWICPRRPVPAPEPSRAEPKSEFDRLLNRIRAEET
jgi:GTP-binding protein EngB required for normal cell division